MRVAGNIGMSVQTAATAWQAYELTGSAMPLAFIGLARFLPNLALSFIGGAVADTRDRRVIMGISQIAPLLTSVWLFGLTATGNITMTAIYLSSAIAGVAGAFQGPASQSLLPQVVGRASFQRAVTLTSSLQQFTGIFGPAAGGVIIGAFGLAPAYLLRVVLMIVGFGCLANIRVAAGSSPRGTISLALIKEGLVFIWTHRPVLGAMSLDMFAVIFASADALLPIYARDILGAGAIGFGLLTSSKAVGALVTSIVMTLLPPVVNTGRTMVITVLMFGVATIAFGFSTWLPLSLVLYALIAGIDQVSVVMRQNIIQLGTPDAFRGRVNSVNQVFVGASNQLGAVESGVVATLTSSAEVAVVSGGIACLFAAAAVIALVPTLWHHRATFDPSEAEERAGAR